MKSLLIYVVFLLFIPFNGNCQKPELIIPSGQNSWIMATKISPDGKYLVSSAMDRSIKIYDLKEKKEVFTFWEHKDYAAAIDIASDNRTVVSADVQGENIVWDLYTGKVLFKCKNEFPYWVTAITISPDNKTFLSADYFGFVSEFNLNSGKLNIRERYHNFKINKIGFIKKGLEFYSSAKDDSITDTLANFMQTRASDKKILRNTYFSSAIFRSSVVAEDGSKMYFVVKNPEQIRVQKDSINSIKTPILDYSPFDVEILSNDSVIIACHKDKKITFLLFDTKTNSVTKVINTNVLFLENHKTGNFRMQITPNLPNKVVYTTGYQGAINCTDIVTGITELLIPKKTAYQTPLLLENQLFLAGEDKKLKSWDITNNSLKTLRTSNEYITKINPYKYGIIIKEYSKILLWEKNFTKIKDSIILPQRNFKIYLSPDSTKVAIDLYDKTLKIYDLLDSKLLKSIDIDYDVNDKLTWYDNKTLAYIFSSNENSDIVFLDLDGSKKIAPISLNYYSKENISEFTYNFEMNQAIIAYNGTINIINNSGKSLKVNKISTGICYLLKYQPRLKQIIASFEDGEVFFLNSQTLEIEKHLKGHKSWTTDLTFSEDFKKIITTSYDNTIKIWDYEKGTITSTLSLLNGKDWVVVSENGLFDASPQAMKDIYYVVNDATDTDEPWKIIDLEQLKHRYYQPNLLQIQLGYNKEPLRTPITITEIPLAPKISTSIVDNKLKVTVKNQKGGIGKVVFFIENAEIIADLRPNKKSDQDAKDLTIVIDLDTYKNRFTASKEVSLKVIAWNKEEWIKSRPEIINYTPIQSKGAIANSIATKNSGEIPRLFGLIVGTSDYAGKQIDLNYAAKDAIDFANALRITSENLFDKNNTTVELLNSDSNDAKQKPSRENILNALKAFEAKIKPSDILVVYLSGHGVNYGGAEGDFYYLTQEASGADAAYLNDEGVRNSSTISSTELTKLLNSITAKKKLLILDACASGKAAEKMTSSKDVPASQIRALDRMQDRTGFYILAGSASDAVSYESSVYGQGLLTYSLLKAIKGSALREDGKEEYIDVQKLFQFAVDEVPELSKNIGGIQKPFFKSPDNQQSYDIGKVDLPTKNKIIISEPKPVFIEAVFSDSESLYDELGLSETFNANLQENAAKGKNADIAFMRVKEYAGAYRISGSYTQSADEIKLHYIVIQNKKPIQPISTILIPKNTPIQDSITKIIESLKSKIN
jgi:WD40 repeat protein